MPSVKVVIGVTKLSDLKQLTWDAWPTVDELASAINEKPASEGATLLKNLDIGLVASIADNVNVSSAKLKAILDTGELTDPDRVATILDGSSLTADDAASHIENGITNGVYTIDQYASFFNSTYLAIAKAASILNSANISVNNVVQILNSANLSKTRTHDIFWDANIAGRRDSILEANVLAQLTDGDPANSGTTAVWSIENSKGSDTSPAKTYVLDIGSTGTTTNFKARFKFYMVGGGLYKWVHCKVEVYTSPDGSTLDTNVWSKTWSLYVGSSGPYTKQVDDSVLQGINVTNSFRYIIIRIFYWSTSEYSDFYWNYLMFKVGSYFK